MIMYHERLSTTIENLKYCSKDLKNLNKLYELVGGNYISNLLLHVPYDYSIYIKTDIKTINNGDNICVPLKIIDKKAPKNYNFRNKKRIPYRIICYNEYLNVEIEMLFFIMNTQHFESFKIGDTKVFSGKINISLKSGKYSIYHPQVTILHQYFDSPVLILRLNTLLANQDIILDELQINKIVPIYKTCNGISQNNIRNLIKSSFELLNLDYNVVTTYNKKYITELKLEDFLSYLLQYHFPENVNNIEIMRKNLAEFEIWIIRFLFLQNNQEISNNNGIPIVNSKKLVNIAIKNLPFELTSSQQKVLNEIFYEQAKNIKLSGLLQGDVGSGKTIVAILAILNVVESNKCGVIMAPTAILAQQHYEFIKKLCFGMGLTITLITGSTNTNEKKQIYANLRLNTINILIGTHSLINDNIEISNAGLFVIDEQQNFGIKQRLKLIKKAEKSDILMMSATPIPRTFAMMMYGDIEMFTIDQKPLNRKTIITSIIHKSKYNTLIESIHSQLKKEGKIYWICPLIDESEESDLTDVKTRLKELTKSLLNINIGFLYGSMRQIDKNKAIEKFYFGETKILVSTTAIEVGIDVKDANIIVIEHPEQFGLSQLHQLRGRVGRGNIQSYCILLYDKLTEISKKRLEILKNNDDGFKISIEDLKIRGSGNLNSNKQSGFGQFYFLDSYQDLKRISEIVTESLEYKNKNLNELSIFQIIKIFQF